MSVDGFFFLEPALFWILELCESCYKNLHADHGPAWNGGLRFALI